MTSSSLDEQLVQATIYLDIPKMESALQQGANPNTFNAISEFFNIQHQEIIC